VLGLAFVVLSNIIMSKQESSMYREEVVRASCYHTRKGTFYTGEEY
jgi:hypothetical protein